MRAASNRQVLVQGLVQVSNQTEPKSKHEIEREKEKQTEGGEVRGLLVAAAGSGPTRVKERRGEEKGPRAAKRKRAGRGEEGGKRLARRWLAGRKAAACWSQENGAGRKGREEGEKTAVGMRGEREKGSAARVIVGPLKGLRPARDGLRVASYKDLRVARVGLRPASCLQTVSYWCPLIRFFACFLPPDSCSLTNNSTKCMHEKEKERNANETK